MNFWCCSSSFCATDVVFEIAVNFFWFWRSNFWAETVILDVTRAHFEHCEGFLMVWEDLLSFRSSLWCCNSTFWAVWVFSFDVGREMFGLYKKKSLHNIQYTQGPQMLFEKHQKAHSQIKKYFHNTKKHSNPSAAKLHPPLTKDFQV